MPNIDDQIRKAMEEGQFENLPGKGRPLHLDDNVHEDPEWRMAFHMLKNAGYGLPWIEKRQEILTALDTHRQALQRAWAWRKSALDKNQPPAEVEAEWQRAVTAFQDQITDINRSIRDLNLETPVERFQLPRLKIDREISDICNQVEE